MGIYPFFPDIKIENKDEYFYVIFKHPTTNRPYISSEAYTKAEIAQFSDDKEILKLIPLKELVK